MTINDYITSKGITLQKFSNITGLSYSLLSARRYSKNPSFGIEAIGKIYEGTKKEFGEGLTPYEYMDFPKFD